MKNPSRKNFAGIRPLSPTASCFGLAFALLASACSQGGRGNPPSPEINRLDVLTSFTIAVSKRDFNKAMQFLAPEERLHFGADAGNVPESLQERLRALRLATLNNDPRITLSSEGKIQGVYAILPVIDGGPVVDLDALPKPVALVPEPREPTEEDRVREAAQKLFQSIRDQDWDNALNRLAPDERRVFLDDKGKIDPESRQRLSAIDTTSWKALSLKNEKLTGVVLIIPKPAVENPSR
jgi:hypothetical protein